MIPCNHAASATINELAADPKHLGASAGYICILHTWGSEMNFHPHIHTILLGGGLTQKNEWKDNGTEFFLPIQIISKVFRGKYMEELKKPLGDRQLKFHGTAKNTVTITHLKELLNACYSTEWIPYCKKAFNGAQSVIDYLGKYTHRIAISNHRIICMDEETVTFSVKDYRNKGQWKELTLSGIEFIRRFLMHVHQSVLYEFGITDFFVPAAKEKSLLYAGIFSDAENIFQNCTARECLKY